MNSSLKNSIALNVRNFSRLHQNIFIPTNPGEAGYVIGAKSVQPFMLRLNMKNKSKPNEPYSLS